MSDAVITTKLMKLLPEETAGCHPEGTARCHPEGTAACFMKIRMIQMLDFFDIKSTETETFKGFKTSFLMVGVQALQIGIPEAFKAEDHHVVLVQEDPEAFETNGQLVTTMLEAMLPMNINMIESYLEKQKVIRNKTC